MTHLAWFLASSPHQSWEADGSGVQIASPATADPAIIRITLVGQRDRAYSALTPISRAGHSNGPYQ